MNKGETLKLKLDAKEAQLEHYIAVLESYIQDASALIQLMSKDTRRACGLIKEVYEDRDNKPQSVMRVVK